MSSDPKAITIKFLRENGYPFEMKVAREFRKLGFGIAQSVYFNDPNLNIAREIDVIAVWQEKYFEKKFTIVVITECKYAKTPWILFSSLTKTKEKCYSTSAKGWKWLAHLVKQPSFENFFEVTSKVGYGLTIAINDNDKQKDNAYKAVQTILSFLKSENLTPKFSKEDYTIIIPIIAIRGKLFESHLNDSDEIEIEEINEAQLFYNEGSLGITPKIHIITEDILTEYIQRIKDDVNRLFIDPYMNISIVNPPLSEIME
jgi:hypothetical protein